jgi:uncharacterized membrane protein HdeD (DUF308 family)
VAPPEQWAASVDVKSAFSLRGLPWDLWAAAGVMVLLLIAGVVKLFQPAETTRVAPLLGVVEQSRPTPSPTPESR